MADVFWVSLGLPAVSGYKSCADAIFCTELRDFDSHENVTNFYMSDNEKWKFTSLRNIWQSFKSFKIVQKKVVSTSYITPKTRNYQ